MGWYQAVQTALTAVFAFAPIVSAQGFYANVTQETAQCSNYPFVVSQNGSNCYTTFPLSTFAFQPKNFMPNQTGSTGYQNSFAGFWSSSPDVNHFNATVMPITCAQVCRGFGMRSALITAGNCHCGMLSPNGTVLGALTSCDGHCSADKNQGAGGNYPARQCGGATNNAVSFFLDTSFAKKSDIVLADTQANLRTGYQFLGCFYNPSFVTASPDPATEYALTTTPLNFLDCAGYCASLGYPMATLGKTGAACSCGTSFGPGSYQIDLTQDSTSCRTSCSSR